MSGNKQLKSPILRAAVAELIGTFCLVFFGCGSIMIAERFPGSISPTAIPVVFGAVVTAMIYAIGHISGAHLNPAVTLAFTVSRHFPVKKIAPYISAQMVGAFIAVAILVLLLPTGHSLGGTHTKMPVMIAAAWEAIQSFVLMFVIMGVATDTRAVGTMAGVAIGATVMLDAFVGGPITGASMNPARSIAPLVIEGAGLAQLLLYAFAPIIGTLIAALTYRYVRKASSLTSKP